MSSIGVAHKEDKESSPSTNELLASLFEEPKESKIRRVREKTHPKPTAVKSKAAVRTKKDVQPQTPRSHRGNQTRPSGSEIKARPIKKNTQIRKSAVPRVITKKDPRIKVYVQEEHHKTVTEKRSAPAIRKSPQKRVHESSIMDKEKPAVSVASVAPLEASRHAKRRSMFGATTLGIGLPFVIGVILTLGTRYVSLDFFDSDRGTVLANNEVVETPAPKNQDVTIMTASAAAVDIAKQENENEVFEASSSPKKETIDEVTHKEPDTPVSEIPQKTILTAKQRIPSAIPELSTSTHSSEAERTKTFQWDESKSYPYSVYLGSYKNTDRAREAISIFQKKGLSPYWVKVDLGEKGVWYRVLAGYFQTKDEVEAFIEEHQITDGRSRYVLYANFIGLYNSDEELKEKNLSLVELGYSPYVIEGDNGESLLLSGAFYYKADAEKEQIELASKGIQSQLVKR